MADMESVLNFIKDFKVSQIGLSIEKVIILFVVLLLIVIVSNLINKYRPTKTNKIINVLGLIICFSLIAFLIIKSILNENYWNLIVAALMLISTRIHGWVNMYDKWIDKIVNK